MVVVMAVVMILSCSCMMRSYLVRLEPMLVDVHFDMIAVGTCDSSAKPRAA